jgi:diguanylate cyclase (GGDEF)-like protein
MIADRDVAIRRLVGDDVVTAVDESNVERIEQLLRFDARGALDTALEKLESMPDDTDTVAYQRWLLVKGAAQARLGETEDGARIMREVRVWADEHGEHALLAATHRRLSALYKRVGDPALMLEHAVRAVELLDDDADAWVQGDHLLGLADALGAGGSFEESIARYHEAAALAEQCDDRFLQLIVLNNLSYTQYEAGQAQEAVETAERLLAEVAADGQPLLRHFGDSVARAYISVGRFEDAAAVLGPLCDDTDSGEDCDGLALALLTLAEVRRLQGNLDAAQECIDRSFKLIQQYALTGRYLEVMREQAELHAARGEFEAAYYAYRAFHRAEAELRAVERDARARTLNAIFEATEARRQSDHFRELSVRDPLTGLHNRRHMDVVLADLLEQVEQDGASLTIGLVDLDHFKRINDTRSHAVGDEVLRQVAGILVRSAESVDNGLAVRMGGEEFLVLLPQVDRDAGLKQLEDLRQEIAAHPWGAVTDGIPVTVSIGIAVAPDDGTERRALLEVADANLYRAKHNGRDCVVS